MLRKYNHWPRFAVVPGSHKVEYALPDFLEPAHDLLAADGAPMTVTIPLQPGDAVVFSTNLYHDAAA